MHPIQIAHMGLFLLLLEMAILTFADAVIIFGVGSMMATGDLDFGLKMFAWGGISLLLGLLLGFLGKLLCFACPEEGARKLIILSVVCDVVAIGLRVAIVTGTFYFFGIGLVIYGLGLASYILFLNFLARMGDNIGEPAVGRFITIIYGLFGTGFVAPALILFSFNLFILVVALEMLVSLALYTYTIWTLFRAMPIYIEEVKAGITDPTESGEDRRLAERKARMKGPGGGGVSKSKPAEEPQGEPPAGALLYRIPKGLGPLELAVKEGDRFKVESQLAAGQDPNQRIRHHLTPLHIAASVGVMDVAEALVQAGADINAVCEENLTPLYFAVQTGKQNIAGFFLDRGADLHHRSSRGYTPLHWACCAPHKNLTGNNRVKMVEFLLDHGADPEARTNEGQTARELALANQLNELISFLDIYLGKAPTPVKPAQDSSSQSVSHPTMTDDCPGSHLCIVPGGLSPLLAACKEGDPYKVQLQIAGGADLGETVENDLGPMHVAAVTGVMGVADLLLKHGCNIDQPCALNITPVFLAIAVNNMNMVGFLVSRGAAINHRNDHGQTPLHWACGVKHPKLEGQNRRKLAELLLRSGADPTCVDTQGRTPLMVATNNGHEELMTLLGQSGPQEEQDGHQERAAEEEGYYV